MTDIERPILRDPAPWVVARWEKKAAERLAREDRKRIERFERKLGLELRCPICGASTRKTRLERCKGACEQ